MASAAVTEYLEKRINIDRSIVTFRLLSRQLSIHVNEAKNELAKFHEASRATDAPVQATYLLSGDVSVATTGSKERREEDMDEDKQQGSEEVMSRRMLLVPEQDLEVSKGRFTRLSSIHVYSLSPSPVKDPGLLIPPTDDIRSIDASKNEEQSKSLGRVVGIDIKYSGSTSTTSSKPPKVPINAGNPAKGTIDSTKASTSKLSNKEKERDKSAAKPKATGVLDWSKASKEPKKEIKKEEQPVDKVSAKTEPAKAIRPRTKSDEPAKKLKTEQSIKIGPPKRGVKRTSPVSDSEADSKPQPPKPQASETQGVKVRKGVLLSDDEEDEKPVVVAKKKASKRKQITSDDEESRSISEMMDIDDDEVIQARPPPTTDEEAEFNDDDVDEEMVDPEPAPTRAKPKRKEKKVIPVGKNGLKKKRVIKSRMTMNERGYMVTEDYSSYESVDEEEEPPSDVEKTKKGKKKSKKQSTPSALEDEESSAEANAPKSKPAKSRPSGIESTSEGSTKKAETTKKAAPATKAKGKPGQQSLMNFFGKKPS